MTIKEKLDKLIEICDAEEELYDVCEKNANDGFHFCRNFHANRILLFECADIAAVHLYFYLALIVAGDIEEQLAVLRNVNRVLYHSRRVVRRLGIFVVPGDKRRIAMRVCGR